MSINQGLRSLSNIFLLGGQNCLLNGKQQYINKPTGIIKEVYGGGKMRDNGVLIIGGWPCQLTLDDGNRKQRWHGLTENGGGMA